MNEIVTNLIGRYGTARIWPGSWTPVEIVAVCVVPPGNRHDPAIRVIVRITRPDPDLGAVIGQLCEVGVDAVRTTA